MGRIGGGLFSLFARVLKTRRRKADGRQAHALESCWVDWEFGSITSFIRKPLATTERCRASSRQLRKRPAANADRINELQAKLQAQGVPMEERGRRQYENRLRFSSEPFGPFALANTFAGFLIVSLLLAGEVFRTSEPLLPKWSLAAWTLLFGIETYCLVLTKSRTAFLAIAIVLFFGGAASFAAAKRRFGRRTFLTVLGAVAAVALLFVVAALGRGFDFQVISEAPKSLEYRLQYWRGALRFVHDHPIFAGPGNFRHRYLAYKLPESSEEIADPHNLFLDLWSSGGIVAIAGLAACIVLALLRAFSRKRTQDHPLGDEESNVRTGWASTVLGPAFGFLLAFTAPLLSGSGSFEPEQLVLLLAWLGAFAVLGRAQATARIRLAALGGAALGLFAHLCGAGGIEMPAIVQLFLMLAALATALSRTARVTPSRGSVFVIGGASIVCFVACLLTGVLPVLNRRALVASGEEALVRRGDSARAIQDFLAASERDPFSPEPLSLAAEAYFLRWQSSPAGPSTDFANGEETMQMAMDRDPFNPALYRRLGELYLAKFARDHVPTDAARAADELNNAAVRYPNDPSRAASKRWRSRRPAALTKPNRWLAARWISTTSPINTDTATAICRTQRCPRSARLRAMPQNDAPNGESNTRSANAVNSMQSCAQQLGMPSPRFINYHQSPPLDRLDRLPVC